MVKRRKFIRTVSYLLALCLVAAVAGGFSNNAKASYEETLENVRFEALNSLCEYMHELSGGLSLLSVSQGDAIADSTNYVSSRAAGAIGSVACFNSKKTVNISRFLDAVFELSQNFSDNELSRETAAGFSDYAEGAYYHLSNLSAAVMGGKYSLSEYGSVYSTGEKPYFEDYLDYSNGKEDEFFGYAESGQVNLGHYAVLHEKETVSLEQAKKKASEIIGIDEVLWREGETTGRNGFEIYSLIHGDTAVEICKSGGALCTLVNPVPCNERVYSNEDALLKAREFLKSQGYGETDLIGGRINSFTADFFFVPKVKGVLLLTASVEISVCLSSGSVTFFDASEYIKNFREDIYAPDTVPDLSSLLSDNLVIEKTAVCLAEIDGRERLCYLAVCPFEGEELWIYIDYSEFKVIKMHKNPFTDIN